MKRFIQIHFLTPYVGALLNRDDVGFAKRLPFGGTERTRISSQCLKRHWRTYEGQGDLDSLGLDKSVRSRETFERMIVAPLSQENNLDIKKVREAATLVQDSFLKKKKGDKGKEDSEESEEESEEEEGNTSTKTDAPLKSKQVVVLGEAEIAYARTLTLDICQRVAGGAVLAKAGEAVLTKDVRKNLQAMKMAGGLSAALFGRMVTSDILARGDAAVHVAHAFTVHEQQSESDFFSAIDDLTKDDGELGSGHISNTELNSGLYYGYVVVDVNLLISNLGGDKEMAGKVVEALVSLAARVTPGAKKGSTAPYAYASAMLVEAGGEQPRTLANAFQRSVSLKGDVLQNTYEKLAAYVSEVDRVYGNEGDRKLVGLDLPDNLLSRMGATDGGTLKELAAWAGACVSA